MLNHDERLDRFKTLRCMPAPEHVAYPVNPDCCLEDLIDHAIRYELDQETWLKYTVPQPFVQVNIPEPQEAKPKRRTKKNWAALLGALGKAVRKELSEEQVKRAGGRTIRETVKLKRGA